MDVIGHQPERRNAHASVVLALWRQIDIDAWMEGGPEHDLAFRPALGAVWVGYRRRFVAYNNMCRQPAKGSSEMAKRDGALRPREARTVVRQKTAGCRHIAMRVCVNRTGKSLWGKLGPGKLGPGGTGSDFPGPTFSGAAA